MIIELHLLQSFSPANLNRDDTGSPKDCEFGGSRRARVSSQCWKRAMREHFAAMPEIVPTDQLGIRTKQIGLLLRDHFVGAGHAEAEVDKAAARLMSDYLVFIGRKDIPALAATCLDHWSDLISSDAKPSTAESAAEDAVVKNPSEKSRAGRNKSKASDKKQYDLKKALKALPDTQKAADVALFGRMIADLPGKNVDAAAQVAHALSTHKVSMDMDYYTALDELPSFDESGIAKSGAAMIGANEFNASCFYRYLNLDTSQLSQNLGRDQDLTRRAIKAYVRAAVEAIPKAKQNSMAARNPPLFVLAVARDFGAWNLANAFLRPVRPTSERDLLSESAAVLSAHWSDLRTMYGTDGIAGAWRCAISTIRSPAFDGANDCSNITQLYDEVLSRVA